MILSKDIKLKLNKPVTNKKIKASLTDKGFDVLRWAITEINDDEYTIRISYTDTKR